MEVFFFLTQSGSRSQKPECLLSLILKLQNNSVRSVTHVALMISVFARV